MYERDDGDSDGVAVPQSKQGDKRETLIVLAADGK